MALLTFERSCYHWSHLRAVQNRTRTPKDWMKKKHLQKEHTQHVGQNLAESVFGVTFRTSLGP